MRSSFVAILAVVATFLNLIRYLPQAWKSKKEGFVGLSLHSWVLGLLEISAWAIWSILAEQWLAGISYFILTPLTAWFVLKIWLAHKHHKTSDKDLDMTDDGVPIP